MKKSQPIINLGHIVGHEIYLYASIFRQCHLSGRQKKKKVFEKAEAMQKVMKCFWLFIVEYRFISVPDQIS